MRAMTLPALGALFSAVLLAACRPEPQAPPASPAPAPVPAPPTAAAAQDLDAVGTEPFWSIQARPGSLLYQRAGETTGAFAADGPQPAVNGGLTWTAKEMKLEIAPGDCSDGMSDRTFPYAATATLAGGEVLKGCAAPPNYFDGQPKP
jgi:uncharacterized membrane protein